MGDEQKKALTSKVFAKAKTKWKKLAKQGKTGKIGKDLVGYYIGHYLVIVQGVYNKKLTPKVWFEIQTMDGISFAMHSKNLAGFLKQNGI
jgi:hypothetical protein